MATEKVQSIHRATPALQRRRPGSHGSALSKAGAPGHVCGSRRAVAASGASSSSSAIASSPSAIREPGSGCSGFLSGRSSTYPRSLLVFGGVIGLTAGHTPYPIFFIFASAAWALFSECVLWSTRSLDVNRGLLREVHVPRLVVIVSAIIPSMIDFAIGIGIGIAALLYYLARVQLFYLELTIWSPTLHRGRGRADRAARAGRRPDHGLSQRREPGTSDSALATC